jgi:predicted small lipoprotein YifL
MNGSVITASRDRKKSISRRFLACGLALAAVMTVACGQHGPLFLPEPEPPLASDSGPAQSAGKENGSADEEKSSKENGKEDETTP